MRVQARKIVQKTVRDTLAERLSAPRNKHGDLLDIIIEELRAEETSLSENLAVDIVSALLFGSVFTLSGTIAVAFKSLHDNPDVLRSLEVLPPFPNIRPFSYFIILTTYIVK